MSIRAHRASIVPSTANTAIEIRAVCFLLHGGFRDDVSRCGLPPRTTFEVTAERSPRGRFEAVPYMAAFLGAARPRCRFTIVVATQTDDGRKFNRGRLMNAAFEV